MVKFILLKVAEYANVKGISGLADALNESNGRLYGWIRNGKISDTGIILTKYQEINPKWLRTGEGPMLKSENPDQQQPANAPQVSTSEEEVPQRRIGKIDEGTEKTKDFLSNSDLLYQTSFVLESDSVYRGALVANIRAYYQSVQEEVEMARLEEALQKTDAKVEHLSQEIRDISAKMGNIESLIMSLGGVIPQKGAKAVGEN